MKSSEELVMLASHIASMQSERDAYLSVASEVGEGAALLLQEKLVVKWKEFKEKLEQLEISAENWQRLEKMPQGMILANYAEGWGYSRTIKGSKPVVSMGLYVSPKAALEAELREGE